MLKALSRGEFFFVAIIIILLSYSCKKENDYRDAFVGTYTCDYFSDRYTYIEIPDSSWTWHTYTYDSNVLFSVTRADDPDKLLILDIPVKIFEDGTLENWWIPGEYIQGRFYAGDSMDITYARGKSNGIVKNWKGKRISYD